MKTETLFGKTVNVVGNVSADLVLESLGKIYIKSRNKALTLDEIISSITSKSEESIANRTIIVDSITDLNVKDGDFVYDKSSDILYIQVDGELNELINVNNQSLLYVKRTGDTMTGSLTIKTPSGLPPLKVTSSILNKNFNSQYLDGLPSSSYALKSKDELISGKWTHSNTTYFNAPVIYSDNTMHYKDSIHTGSLGTPDFASGFGGYGWRLDGATNTLTIDYIVVRKAMYVYELVVNKISATNGSLWVSNASKVEYVCLLPIIVSSNAWASINPASTLPDKLIRSAVNGAKNNDGFIITSSLGTLNWTGEQNADNTGYGTPKTDFNYKNLELIVCNDESKTTEVLEKFSNNNTVLNFSDSNFEDADVSTAYSKYRVFNEYFDDEVVFPIVISKVNWYSDSAGNDNAYTIRYIKTYHKYFSLSAFNLTSSTFLSNLYLVKFDTDNLPVFMPGDILRCLKFTGDGIKYYDAVVCNKLKDSYFVILVSEDIMDKTTTITYDDNLLPTTTEVKSSINKDFYNTTGNRSNNILGKIQEGDNLVLIGHLWDVTRQNAVYITSSDDGAPFIDTMSNVNRPDYSVIYNVPSFKTIKLYKRDNLPFTGNYYIQSKESGIETVQHVLLYLTDDNGFLHSWTFEIGKAKMQVIVWYKLDGNIYSTNFENLYTSQFTDDLREAILSNPVRLLEVPIQGQTVQKFQTYDLLINYVSSQITLNNIKYNNLPLNINLCLIELLREYPNEYTLLITSYEETPIDTESSGELLSEDGITLILESTVSNDTILPTRTTKARFGNLDGIIDSRFSPDKLPHGYGLYGENVFLTGEFVLSNGKNVAQFDKDILALFSGIEMNSVNFANLKLDIRNLLNEVPSYHNLESAGVFLADNKLILFGDSIQIITTLGELGGYDAPTALFANGKINSKFISVYDIHSAWHSDSTPSKVTQVLVTPLDSASYYMEQEVYTKLDANNQIEMEDETHPLYYYMDANNNECRVSYTKVYDAYKDFGWHLKALGDGYFALGNISWDRRGDLNILGNIFLNYVSSKDLYNGLYVIDLNDYTSLIINGKSKESIEAFNDTLVLLFNKTLAQGEDVIIVGENVTGLEYDLYLLKITLFNYEAAANSVMETLLWVNYSSFRSSHARGWELTLYLLLLDNNLQVLIESIKEGSNTININLKVDKVYICIPLRDRCESISGGLYYNSSLRTSLLGSNFIEYYTDNKLLWFGKNEFTVMSKNSNKYTALELDLNDIYIRQVDKSNTSLVLMVGDSNSRKSLTTLLDGGYIELTLNSSSNNNIILTKNSNKHIIIYTLLEDTTGTVLVIHLAGVENALLPGTIFTFSRAYGSSYSCKLFFLDGPVLNINDIATDDIVTELTLNESPIVVMYMGSISIGGAPRAVFKKLI